jgi:UPF0716 protein FxsA
MMARLIPLFLLALPFIEIAVFIQVGEWIGLWPTVGLALLASLLGIQLLRYQGLVTLARAREAARRNEPPVDALADGLCMLLAGLLLALPGFVTDLLGLILLLPFVRQMVRARLWRGFGARERRRAPVIEADYTVLDEGKNERNPRLGDRKGP